MSIENWLNCSEAANLIGCSTDHVAALARNGSLKAMKASERCWLIDKESARKFASTPKPTGRPRKTKSKKTD